MSSSSRWWSTSPALLSGRPFPGIADRSPSDRQALLVELENSPVQDASGNILHESIWETLIGENLHGADLVVSELLVNPHLRVNASTPWWDLRSLAGTDHTVRFRGECVQVEPVGATVPMRFAHVEPEVPFVTLLDQQNNHPEDFGSRMPVIVGQAKAVECKRIKVGTVTTLSAGLAIDGDGRCLRHGCLRSTRCSVLRMDQRRGDPLRCSRRHYQHGHDQRSRPERNQRNEPHGRVDPRGARGRGDPRCFRQRDLAG